MEQNKQIPAVVIGFNHTALGVVRELGRKKIQVTAIDSSKHLCSYSRYCTTCHGPDLTKNPEAFLKALKTLFNPSAKAILFPSNDSAVLFMVRYYNILENYFYMTFGNPEVIKKIVNKNKFYELAASNKVRVPKTFVPKNYTELEKIGRRLGYPVIIKPCTSSEFEEKTGEKLLKINSFTELKKKFLSLNQQFPLMIQEIVAGDENEQFSCSLYMNKSFQSIAIFTARKIRNYPSGFGVGTLVQSVHSGEYLSTAINFLKRIRYTGIAEVEFKKDRKSGNYVMIEINTRSWGQNALAEKCGQPVSYIAYKDIAGETVPGKIKQKNGIAWISVEKDMFAVIDLLKNGKLGWFSYMKSLLHIRVFSLFSFDDPMPFFYYFFYLRHLTLTRLLRKVYRIVSKKMMYNFRKKQRRRSV